MKSKQNLLYVSLGKSYNSEKKILKDPQLKLLVREGLNFSHPFPNLTTPHLVTLPIHKNPHVGSFLHIYREDAQIT